MKRCFERLNRPDIVGLCEVDAKSGRSAEAYHKVVAMMEELGYAHQYFEKNNLMSGQAIFYRNHMFNVLETK